MSKEIELGGDWLKAQNCYHFFSAGLEVFVLTCLEYFNGVEEEWKRIKKVFEIHFFVAAAESFVKDPRQFFW